MPKPEIRYEWSDIEAKYMFKLYKYVLNSVTYHAVFVAEGNVIWAERICEHYGIISPLKDFSKKENKL